MILGELDEPGSKHLAQLMVPAALVLFIAVCKGVDLQDDLEVRLHAARGLIMGEDLLDADRFWQDVLELGQMSMRKPPETLQRGRFYQVSRE